MTDARHDDSRAEPLPARDRDTLVEYWLRLRREATTTEEWDLVESRFRRWFETLELEPLPPASFDPIHHR